MFYVTLLQFIDTQALCSSVNHHCPVANTSGHSCILLTFLLPSPHSFILPISTEGDPSSQQAAEYESISLTLQLFISALNPSIATTQLFFLGVLTKVTP